MKKILLTTIGIIAVYTCAMAYTTVPFKSAWKYLDNGTDQGTAWSATAFNDAAWTSGNAELGYGDADETSTISYGTDANNKYITSYFRKSVTINETYDNFTLNLLRDDGAVVYVNGVEVYRSNMPTGTILYTTLASASAADDGNTQQTVIIPASFFLNGNNVIAVEVHQSAVNSSDLSFDLQLIGNRSGSSALVSWNSIWKYLDNGTDQNTAWIPASFNDGSWAKGAGELGYGDGDEGTVVSYGADANNKYVTTYFRKTFNNPGGFSSYTLSLKRDDGAVVYVNGVEVFRSNLATSQSFSTLATIAAADDGATPQVVMLSSSVFVTGENTIAIEVHQSAITTSDLSMDAELTGNTGSLVSLVDFGEKWRYLDNGTNQATAWRATAFADAAWVQGNAEFGYGDGDENTTVSYGANASAKYITTYFRKVINIADVSAFKGYSLKMFRDDGLVVYVNGTEVWRNNIPYGTVSYTTLATESAVDDGNNMVNFNISSSAFTTGDNSIAVEVHQNAANSSDISFDLQLTGNTNYDITRGPYLQMGSHQSVMVRFRSNSAVAAKILYGTTAGVYTDSVTEGSVTTEHAVSVSSLSPNTKYFYAVKTGNTILQSGAQNYFITAPTPGTEKEINILATGDCGTGYLDQKQVRDRYIGYLGSKHTDVWMLVGDNAYDAGQESEYQTGFFDSYQDTLLKNVLLYPAPGNHDYANSASRQNDHNIPYYTIFNTPTAGELGGVSSGTEAYYSYNYGNIHFISLDSYGKESNTTRLYDTLSPQVVWLKNDLAANTKRWTIVYFHHPPYTMGSHNSDTETELINMRQNLLTILERYKVDLLICGHSHSYERSYLLKGHYGLETTFNMGTHAVSNSSAKYDGTANSCPYVKNAPDRDFGTVYVVTGAAGKFGGTQAAFPHNAMYYSTASYAGATAITINGNRLDAKFVTADGTIRDQFTMMKEVNKNTTVNNNLVDTATINSSWKGSYNWSPVSGTNSSLAVSPASTTSYYVSDNENCLRDTVNVNVIVPTISTGSIYSPLCAGNNITVSFTVTGKFLGGNLFTAQLSDASGSFAAPINIGSVVSTVSGNISCSIPSSTAGGNAYRIRVVSNTPVITGSTNGSNLVVQPLVVWYKDADGDLYSDGNTLTQCTQPGNYYAAASLTALSGDCNDGNAAVNPGVTEICLNGIDDNCNGLIDEACISISGTSTNTICTGTSFGAVNITVSNGSTPYAYAWSNSAVTEDISGLSAGNYSVTVTDIHASTASASFTVGTTSPSAKPATPGTITGSTSVCPDLSIYSFAIVTVANASSYTWTVPANCNLLSGQGTTSISVQFTTAYTTGAITVTATNCIGTSAAKSLTVAKKAKPATPGTITGTLPVCIGSSYSFSIAAVANATSYTWTAPANSTIVSGQGTTSVTISFQTGFVTSNLTVTASNCGGTSTAKTLSVTKATVPVTPGTITGSTAVCPNVTYSYSIATVANATSYTWTVPITATLVSGQGTNAITVTYPSGYTGSSLSVVASNCGGNSPAKTITVAPATISPATPGTITGAVAVCPGTYTYSIVAVANALTYNWTAPANASIVSGQGSTTVSVTFVNGFSTGNLTVSASNCIGTSALRTLALKTIPSAPSAITGPITDVCGTTTGIVYSVNPILGASSYNWVVTGGTITGGQGTTSITVDFPTTFTSATVKVQEITACSSAGAFKSVTVTQKGATPGTITGTTPVCPTMSYTYSIVAVANAISYSWAVPADWTITAGQATNSITVTAGTLAGKVMVSATNTCGTGAAASKTVAIGTTCRLSNPNGITEEENEHKLMMRVYPNPVNSNEVSIELEGASKTSFIQLFDILGQKLISNRSVDNGVNTLDLTQFSTGVYLIEFNDANLRKTERLIIER